MFEAIVNCSDQVRTQYHGVSAFRHSLHLEYFQHHGEVKLPNQMQNNNCWIMATSSDNYVTAGSDAPYTERPVNYKKRIN